MDIFSEINKIQGDREVDTRIKDILQRIVEEVFKGTNDTGKSDAQCKVYACDCEDDDLRAELTDMADKLDTVEEENDILRAELTALSEEGEDENDNFEEDGS